MTQHHQIDIDELFRQRDEYSRQAARLLTAIKYVLTKFEQDEAAGYHTKDREFAITILRKAISQ